MGENRLRRCVHCGQLFTPDARNAHHQRYCPAPACRLASKRASQNKWFKVDPMSRTVCPRIYAIVPKFLAAV